MKIRPVGSCIGSCGRTGMTKSGAAFRKFANAPKPTPHALWGTFSVQCHPIIVYLYNEFLGSIPMTFSKTWYNESECTYSGVYLLYNYIRIFKMHLKLNCIFFFSKNTFSHKDFVYTMRLKMYTIYIYVCQYSEYFEELRI